MPVMIIYVPSSGTVQAFPSLRRVKELTLLLRAGKLSNPVSLTSFGRPPVLCKVLQILPAGSKAPWRFRSQSELVAPVNRSFVHLIASAMACQLAIGFCAQVIFWQHRARQGSVGGTWQALTAVAHTQVVARAVPWAERHWLGHNTQMVAAAG